MIIIVSALIVLLLAGLLFLPVKLSIRYSGTLSFKIYIAGIELPLKKAKRKKASMPEKQASSDENQQKTDEERFSRQTVALSERVTAFADTFKAVTKLTRKFLTVEKFTVQITAGTGSAPSTAISTGLLWATVYNVIGILGSVVYIENPKVEITPEYNQSVFTSYAKCIISTKVAYIILIGITILLKKLSRKGKEE